MIPIAGPMCIDKFAVFQVMGGLIIIMIDLGQINTNIKGNYDVLEDFHTLDPDWTGCCLLSNHQTSGV